MSSPFAEPLQHAHDHALAWIDRFETTPVSAQASLSDLQQALNVPLLDSGIDPVQVIEELVAAVEPGLHVTGSGRFHGWVIGGALPAALAADWLTSAWDQNAGALAVSPVASVVEDVAGEWLKEILGIPATASFTFCTGSQAGHIIALAAARHAVLERVGWNVATSGLSGSPRIRILTTSARHISADRAIRLLGLGWDNVEPLEIDEFGSITAASLKTALEKETLPTILILQAGDLCTGAYDRFSELVDLAHEHNVWVHIDGAIGLWAAASPNYSHLMAGAERADSWITDGHKWLNVPYDSGFCFIADSEAHRSAMSYTVSYIGSGSEFRDTRDWNIEMSRRARGFTAYAAIRSLGRKGIADLVDQCCQRAMSLTLGIGDLAGAEVLCQPVINQGLVRFLDPNPTATEADHDRRTDQVLAGILASGEALFGGVVWNGKHAMRISVSNWRTNDEDINRTLAAIQTAIAAAVPA